MVPYWKSEMGKFQLHHATFPNEPHIMTNDTSVTDFPFLARQLTRKFLVSMLQDVVSRDSRGIILRETQERNFDIALLAHCHYITIQAKWDLFS